MTAAKKTTMAAQAAIFKNREGDSPFGVLIRQRARFACEVMLTEEMPRPCLSRR